MSKDNEEDIQYFCGMISEQLLILSEEQIAKNLKLQKVAWLGREMFDFI